MQKTILKFGLFSGLLASALMAITVPFTEQLSHGPWAYVLGYAAIVLSLLLVFFGVRSYRDTVGGGRISFGRAFAVGISITVISCLFYVVAWEIVYFNFLHGSMDSYWAAAMAKVRSSGASAAEIQKQLAKLQASKQAYENPLNNAAMTFMEPFPVGLLVTLISAGVLRRKEPRLIASSAVEG